MASQLTHIVLADKLYDAHFSGLDKAAFYCGNIFPDIRYLAVIDRSHTHFKGIKFDQAKAEPDAFQAGMKLHSVVDLVMENYILKRKVYEMCPPSDFVTQTLKMFVDEHYYGKIKDWAHVVRLIATPQQVPFDLDMAKVDFWYRGISGYASQPPTDETRKQVITGIGFPEPVADKINQDLKIIRANPQITAVLDEFYESWKF